MEQLIRSQLIYDSLILYVVVFVCTAPERNMNLQIN